MGSLLQKKQSNRATQRGALGSQEVCVCNDCNQTPVPKDGRMIQLCRTAFGGGDFPYQFVLSSLLLKKSGQQHTTE